MHILNTRKSFTHETLAPSAVVKADKMQYAKVSILPESFYCIGNPEEFLM